MKKNIFAKLAAVTAAAAAALFITACSGQSAPAATSAATTAANVETEAQTTAAETEAVTEAAAEADGTVIRIGAMSGPTAMGMVKLMNDSEEGNTANTYEFAELGTDATAFVAPISKGELDIAAVPANLASVLYNKTNGGVKVLAVNVLGVLNLVERGDSMNSITDAIGKKIYATGQSAVPEYTIRYILTQNGIDPDKDLEIVWCADTTEALSYLKAEDGAAAILPQPFVTAASAQIEDLRVVQDLNEAWDALDAGCRITTGVAVVRTAFAEEHPEAVETFLKEYSVSAAYTSEDVDGAAELIAKYGIVAKAPLAKKALPNCHIVCLTGAEMKEALSGFLQVIYDMKAEAVGGAMPGDDFYYGN